MTEYQRMTDVDSQSQVKTALHDRNDEESSKSKVQQKASEEVEEIESADEVQESEETNQVLSEQEQAQRKIFESFKQLSLPLCSTKNDLEYKDYCIAYNNDIICISSDWIGQYSTDDDQHQIFQDHQGANKDDVKKEDLHKIEQAEQENQDEGGSEAQEKQQTKQEQKEDEIQKPEKNIFTFVESFPDLYKVVLGTYHGDVIVLSAIDFSYENSYQTKKGQVIDLIASKKNIFSMHEGGFVCKLNISSKKINDFKEIEFDKKGKILAIKISPNKRWLAYTQELGNFLENEQKSWDLVLKDLEKSYHSNDFNQDDNNDQAQNYLGLHKESQDDNKDSDEIRYPIKIYSNDMKPQDRQKKFGNGIRPYPILQQLKDLFQFTSDSKNIVIRTDLRVVKSFSVDKNDAHAVVEKLCGDNSRVLKLQILSDNTTLICMSGGDKDLVEDIKIVNLESTKKQIKLGCSDPLDFCCSSDGKMIFVADLDHANKKTVLKGYDLKSQIQLINHQNLHNIPFTTEMSLDNNFLYLNYYGDSSTLNSLNYLKLTNKQMPIEEKEVIMDDKCEFLMQHNKKTGYAELWDLKTNLIKAVYIKSYPKSVCGEYFYCVADLKEKKQEKQQIFRVSSSQDKNYDQQVCTKEIESYIFMVQVTKDNKFLYLMDKNYFKIIDIEKNEQTNTLKYIRSRYPENYVSLQLSHDEKYVLYASDDNLFKYPVENGKFLNDKCQKTQINWHLTKFDAFSLQDDYLFARQFQTDQFEKFDLKKFETTKLIKGHKKDRVLHTCFVDNGKNLVTMTAKQLIYWEIKEDELIKKGQVDNIITPVYGHNNKLKGLRVDGTLYPWSKHLVSQLSNNFPELDEIIKEYKEKGISDAQCDSYLKSLKSIQGPYNRLFPFVFKYFETFEVQDDLNKIAIVKHMLQNTISPEGFTFLSYGFQQKFTIDHCLKKKSITSVNILVDFVANDQTLVEQLNHEEICQLLKFSPSNLPKLIKNSVTIIKGAALLGIDINENKIDFLATKIIEPEKLHDLLCRKDAKEEDKKLVVYKNISFKLNLIPGSKESIKFHQCLAQCTESDVFNQDAIQYILRYKIQLHVTNLLFPLFISICFVSTLIVHLYKPGCIRPLVFLLLFAFYIYQIELSGTYKKLGTKRSKMNLLIVWMTVIYCITTIIKPTKITDYMLPIINLLSCFNLVSQSKCFPFIRSFMIVLEQSVVSIKAFLIFFLLMLITFTLTQLFQKKVKDRWTVFDKKIQEAKDQGIEFDMTYNEKLYELKIVEGENEINLSKNSTYFKREFTLMFYDTYLKMLGEFGDVGPDKYNYFEMVTFVLLTFILCVTLLNLVIALMSSAFEDFKEQKVSQSCREMNRIILNSEINSLKFIQNLNKVENQYLIWMEYQEDNMEKKSETTQINEMMVDAQVQLKNIISDVRNQDDKIDKLASAQSILQKDVVQMNSSLSELIKLIKKDKAQE